MSKFKIKDVVRVINTDSLHFQRNALVLEFNTDCSGDRRCKVGFSDGKHYYCYESSLELLETKPPFNLEQFKAGVPAITRDGRVARFDYMYGKRGIIVLYENIGPTYVRKDGVCISSSASDLMYMQVTQAKQEQPVQQPTEPNLNSKRYKWFKQYLMSDLTIDSLENEIVDCESSQEFDFVIDKYSEMITFSKP